MRKFLIIFVAFLGLYSCEKDSNNDAPREPYDQTVLIYMSGENDLTLDHIIVDELKELRKGSHDIGNNALVVYVDNSSEELPYILQLEDGVTKDSFALPNDPISSSPETMSSILEYTSTHFPAHEYGIVLWGHATAWVMGDSTVADANNSRRKAYGIDNGHNNSSIRGTWMNLPTLAKTLSDWNQHLRFILADCCQFQSIECAYELRNVTDYIIASPAEIPGIGAPYNTVTKYFFDQTDSFCHRIVDAYFAQKIPVNDNINGYTYHYMSRTPLSVVKTSQLPQLAKATNKVLRSFLKDAQSPYPNTGNLLNYGSAYNIKLHDMNDFMLHYAAPDAYAEWKEAFDSTVIYKKYGKDGWMTNGQVKPDNFSRLTDERYGGMSMYIPQGPASNDYQKYIANMGWYWAAKLYEVGW